MTFKSDTTLLYFLMIWFTINIVNATPLDFNRLLNDDYSECLRQIKFAFKSDTSIGCFKYAVEYYKKGDDIPVNDIFIPSTSNQSQNFASTSNQSQNFASTSNQSQNFAITSDQSNNFANNFTQNPNFAITSDQIHNFPITSDQSNNFANNFTQNPNIAITSDQIHNFPNTLNSLNQNPNFSNTHINTQNNDEQMPLGREDFNTVDQDFAGQTSWQDDISLYLDSFEGLQDFIKKDFQNNAQIFDMPGGQKDFGGQSSGQEESFDGSQDFIEADSFINYQDLYGQSSQQDHQINIDPFSNQTDSVGVEPTFYVDDYQNQMFYSQTGENQYAPVPTFNADKNQNPMFNTPAVQHQYAPIPTFNADENQNSTINTQAVADKTEHHKNFATAYYEELESMVQGYNIYPPIPFCRNHYPGDPNCLRALKIFGDNMRTSKPAVLLALTIFKLTECGNPYIYSYMQHIIQNLNVLNPSKGPKKFCLEIYSLKPWYLKLKGYAI